MRSNRRSTMTLLGAMAVLSAPALSQERPAPLRPPTAERIEIETERRTDSRGRGWLGLHFDMSGEGNPTIRDVYPGSPAERAGVAVGDELVSVDGRPARTWLRGLRLSPGDTIRLRLRREGQERDAVLVADARDSNVVIVRTGSRERVIDLDSLRRVTAVHLDSVGGRLDSLFVHMDTLRRVIRAVPREILRMDMDSAFRNLPETLAFSLEMGSRALAGAEFTQLDPKLGRYFRTDKGLLTLRVAPRTPAAEAGLEPGDVIVRVDGEEVGTLADLRQRSSRARRQDGEPLRLEVLRDGTRREIELKVKAERFLVAPRAPRAPRPPAPPRAPRAPRPPRS